MTTDSPTESSLDILADKMRQCNVHSQVPWDRITETQREEWRVTARDALKSMGEGDCTTNSRQASEILVSPATNDLIAKLEALLTPTVEHAQMKRVMLKIIRAHKPAPVDLEKCVNAIVLADLYNSNIPGAKEYYKAIAKAVIQAMGREVL